MLFTRVFAAFLLATTASASPLALDRRDCPASTLTTTTVVIPTPTTSTALTIGTIWQTTTTLGRITATRTTKYTFSYSTTKTIYSPAVTTVPVTTISSTVTAPPSTSVWITLTLTTTLPGAPPTDPCFVTTCFKTVLPTATITITYDILYAYGYTIVTDHVSTVTKYYTKTSTQTTTVPKSTKVLSTVYTTRTYIPLTVIAETVWKTAYSTPIPTFCG
ncbi:hypothetical protein H072_11210 [Dactylellina haptotyla CBS 200.50]|uniref:Uncharacterized protein n=1 Tax=Dactylellina haptotyla (strain CBS 200.50) TaxID=1284197 RepID=S7ZY89_DACHA|nr:hypothetical protein H072_11210 [Dactylellina haptotyla CBS 200.50]